MMLETDHSTGFIATESDPLRYSGQGLEPYESAALILSCLSSGARVLDVGCGTGSISCLLRDHRGCEVTGLEPHGQRANAARAAGIHVIEAPFQEESVRSLGTFDAVIFADVLEHLPHPADALILAKTLLRTNGCIVTSIPNVAHWSVRWELLCGRFNYRELGIMDATHLRWFTSDTIRQLFQSAGLRIERIHGTAGLWMKEYWQGRPWKWFSPEGRKRFVLDCLTRWPGLFACQFVVKASPHSSHST